MSKALDIQVGGSHYKNLKIQPVEYIHANNIGYFEGNVIKYVTRWRTKNGVADLEKAKHYIDLLIEQEKMDEGSRTKAQSHPFGQIPDYPRIGIPTTDARRINDTSDVKQEWPKFPSYPNQQGIEPIPSITDHIRKELPGYEQQRGAGDVQKVYVQSPMVDSMLRGSSISFATRPDWPA